MSKPLPLWLKLRRVDPRERRKNPKGSFAEMCRKADLFCETLDKRIRAGESHIGEQHCVHDWRDRLPMRKSTQARGE